MKPLQQVCLCPIISPIFTACAVLSSHKWPLACQSGTSRRCRQVCHTVHSDCWLTLIGSGPLIPKYWSWSPYDLILDRRCHAIRYWKQCESKPLLCFSRRACPDTLFRSSAFDSMMLWNEPYNPASLIWWVPCSMFVVSTTYSMFPFLETLSRWAQSRQKYCICMLLFSFCIWLTPFSLGHWCCSNRRSRSEVDSLGMPV